jgi:hypothetical protein
MATEEHDEDLSELSGDALYDRIRGLVDEGWQPVSLHLTRERDSREDDRVLRDDVAI